MDQLIQADSMLLNGTTTSGSWKDPNIYRLLTLVFTLEIKLPASSWWPTSLPSWWTSSTNWPTISEETASMTWLWRWTSQAWWCWPPSTCQCPPPSPAPLLSNLWRCGYSSTWLILSLSSLSTSFCRWVYFEMIHISKIIFHFAEYLRIRIWKWKYTEWEEEKTNLYHTDICFHH